MRGLPVGLIAIAAVVAMAGCAIGGPSRPAPTGPIQLLPGAPEPDGEITVAATGSASDTGWRLLVWESGDLLCRQLDVVAISNLDCGRIVVETAFRSVSVGAELGRVHAIHGFVDGSVESVSARADDGTSYDVPVMPGGPGGGDFGLFVIMYPSTASIVAITAYGAGGAVLEERDVE